VLRRRLAPVTLVVAIVLELRLIVGVRLDVIRRVTGYEIAYVALPGVALLWALRKGPKGFLESNGLGMPLGYPLEILAFSATATTAVRRASLAGL
jgi:hypothetical protein